MSRHAPLTQLLWEDWATHDRSWSAPGFHALAVQRLGRWRLTAPRAVRILVGGVYWALKTIIRNVYGVEMYDTTVIGRRVRLVHHVGIVLGSSSVIGNDVTIDQNVTLGALGPYRPGEHPTIGARVKIGAGTVIAGPVHVGDDVTIGARSVVLQDLPDGSTVSAPQARIRTAELR